MMDSTDTGTLESSVKLACTAAVSLAPFSPAPTAITGPVGIYYPYTTVTSKLCRASCTLAMYN